MKRVIIFLVLAVFATCAFGQYQFERQRMYTQYRQQNNMQQNAGWILLATGSAATVVGFVGLTKGWDDGSNGETEFFSYLLSAGLISCIASIPFFIGAKKDKRKAASMTFGFDSLAPRSMNVYACKSEPVPVIKLSIKL